MSIQVYSTNINSLQLHAEFSAKYVSIVMCILQVFVQKNHHVHILRLQPVTPN